MALHEAGAGDADELAALAQGLDVLGAAVAHGGAQAADQLEHGVGQGALEGHAALDALGQRLSIEHNLIQTIAKGGVNADACDPVGQIDDIIVLVLVLVKPAYACEDRYTRIARVSLGRTLYERRTFRAIGIVTITILLSVGLRPLDRHTHNGIVKCFVLECVPVGILGLFKVKETNDEEKVLIYLKENQNKEFLEFLEPKKDRNSINEEFLNKGILPKCFPTSITIPPNSTSTVSEKILMQDELILDIVGIKYGIFNVTTEQYVNPDGNGLYFSCENILKDDYYSTIITGKKKLYVNLNDIQIYKEMPRLDIIKVNNIYDNDTLNLYEYQEFLFNFEMENKGNYNIDEIDYFVYVYKKEDYKVCIKEGNIKHLININDKYNFEYKYFHLSAHYKIEFRFYLKSDKYEKENENSEELISPYIFYFKKLNTNNLLNFSFPKIIPQINSNSIEEICKMDKRLPNNFKYVYSFNKKIFSFNASNTRKNKIFLEIKDNNNLIKKEIITDDYSKEIEFEINSGSKLSDIKIEWECDSGVINNLKGAMSIGDIFPNLKNDFVDENFFGFSLDVDKKNNEECGNDINIFEIKYCVKNNSDKNFNNLKLMCYVYQNINEGEISLNDDLFYEGSLISFKNNLKQNEELINKIVIYLDKKFDNYCTTFLLINSDDKIVYMSPINRNLI